MQTANQFQTLTLGAGSYSQVVPQREQGAAWVEVSKYHPESAYKTPAVMFYTHFADIHIQGQVTVC